MTMCMTISGPKAGRDDTAEYCSAQASVLFHRLTGDTQHPDRVFLRVVRWRWSSTAAPRRDTSQDEAAAAAVRQ